MTRRRSGGLTGGVGAAPGQAEPPQASVDLSARAAVEDEVDAREGPPENRGRVRRVLRSSVLRKGAVGVPVPVHLRQRPDVDALPRTGNSTVEVDKQSLTFSPHD